MAAVQLRFKAGAVCADPAIPHLHLVALLPVLQCHVRPAHQRPRPPAVLHAILHGLQPAAAGAVRHAVRLVCSCHAVSDRSAQT